MTIDDIRAQINSALAHEERTGDLVRHVGAVLKEHAETHTSAGQNEIDARAAAVVTMLREYVASLPEIIEATIRAADDAGAREHVEPVFHRALSYLSEEGDFIPDRLGLAGIVDDAYIVRELMQELSHRHRMVTGHPLIPSDIGAINQRVRRMIGEPTATRMDAAIIAFARRQDVRETIDNAMSRIGGQRLSMSLPISTAFADDGELAGEIPDLKLDRVGQR